MAAPQSPADRHWLTEATRLTVFPVVPGTVKAEAASQWWKAVAGDDPEEQSIEQRGISNKLKGTVGGASTEFTVSPMRMELKQSAQLLKPEAEGIQTLGPLEDVMTSFLTLATKWFAQAPPLKRVALGVTLLHPVADTTAGNAFLQEAIGRDFAVSDNLRDLLYRVNRPRPVQLVNEESIQVNRLQTWTTVSIAILPFGIDLQGITTVPGGSATFAGQLELDINTPGERRNELPKDSLVPLVNRLGQLATEIAQKGDIP